MAKNDSRLKEISEDLDKFNKKNQDLAKERDGLEQMNYSRRVEIDSKIKENQLEMEKLEREKKIIDSIVSANSAKTQAEQIAPIAPATVVPAPVVPSPTAPAVNPTTGKEKEDKEKLAATKPKAEVTQADSIKPEPTAAKSTPMIAAAQKAERVDIVLTARAAAPGADASLKSATDKKLADDKKVKEDAILQAQGQAPAATLTAAGAKPQPVLEADTDEPKKKATPGKLDKFPQFPTGDWVKQLMWLLDILFFNSSMGRPQTEGKGLIERAGNWIGEKLADFKENNPNAYKFVNGLVSTPFKIAYGVGKAAVNTLVGGGRVALGMAMTAGAVIAAPIALTRTLREGGSVKEYFTAAGGSQMVKGVAQIGDGIGNIGGVLVTAVNGIRDFCVGTVGLTLTGLVSSGLKPETRDSYNNLFVSNDKRLDNLERTLAGNGSENRTLLEIAQGVEPKASTPSSQQSQVAAIAERVAPQTISPMGSSLSKVEHDSAAMQALPNNPPRGDAPLAVTAYNVAKAADTPLKDKVVAPIPVITAATPTVAPDSDDASKPNKGLTMGA